MNLLGSGHQNLKGGGRISRKIMVAALAIGAGLISATLILLLPILKSEAVHQASVRARLIAESVAAVAHENPDHEKMERALLRFSRAPALAYIHVTNAKGLISSSSQQSMVGTRLSLTSGRSQNGHVIEESFIFGGYVDIVVLVGLDSHQVFQGLTRLAWEIGFALAFIILAMAIFLSWYVDRTLGTRLRHLILIMNNAQKGAFLGRAKPGKADEIGDLADAFNRVLAALTNFQVREIEFEQDLQVANEQLSTTALLEEKTCQLKESHENLQRRVKAQELFIEVAHEVSGTLNKDELLKRLVTLVRDKLGWADFAVFWVRHASDQEASLHLAIASGLPDIEIIRSLKFHPGEGITGLVAQSGIPLVVNDLALETRIKLREYVQEKSTIPDFLYHGSMLSVPMICQNKVIGVMDFFHPSKNAFDQDDVALLQALGAQVAVAVVNAELYHETLELTIYDPLTGAINRREMERKIAYEVARSQRYLTPLSVLMVDIDSFKAYNDRMGHVLGDVALREVAIKIQSSIREVDTVARFGGEEFCVILPRANSHAAFQVAQKLNSMIRTIEIDGADQQMFGSLTVSIGVATYPEDLPAAPERGAVTELIHAADQALYAAKKAGRNQAVTFSNLSTVKNS